MFRKLRSMAKIIMAMTTVPTITITALFCSSDQVGQDTLCISSFQVSSKYILIFFIPVCFARVERLELPALGFGDQCSTN